MSEINIVNQTTTPNTIKSLEKDLRTLGVKKGDVLLVHASLSKIGWVCGGAQSVVNALMNVIGDEGTLVMPSHSGDWSDPAQWGNPPVPKEWYQMIYQNMPAFDSRITPTRGMGRIAELFRTYPEVMRSNHPQVSFCAYGNKSEAIVKEHPLTPQFGMNSPLGKLYKLKAKVLLLGVGYDSCTSFHLSETVADGMPRIKMGTSINEEGKRLWKWFKDFDYDADDFKEIGKSFEEEKEVQKGKVGNAKSKLFHSREGVDFASEWLKMNRLSQEFKKRESTN